ncbi:extracellular solute-binding protein [Fluviibacterium sp. DFM31]|uniref:Extracellular solute-binding protein n=1 Tax=Meridianimarinicoccus marinus TaxID=3231483 RepID=A0ABV3L5S7_9RHOB
MTILRSSVAPAAVAAMIAGTALADTVTLDVTAWKGNESEPAGLPQLIEAFEAANPDIDVEFSYISRLDTNVVLPPRLQGNNAPDVMMTDMPLVKVWSDAGLLADLGTDSDWYGRIEDSLKPSITSGDATHIMPLEVIGMGNFVNMGLLKQAGVDKAPTTIAELKDACGKLDAAGIKPMIFTGGFSAPLFVIANGIEAMDAPASTLGGEEAGFADSAAFNGVLDTVRELIDAKCVDPKAQAGLDPWSTALTEFKAGNFAMMPQGAWNIVDFSSVDGLDYVFAPVPSAKNSGVALDLFGIGWSMSEQSQHKEAAKTFIEYFADPENLQVMLDAEAAYSPFKGGASGTPDLAAPYDQSRIDGGVIMYPFAVLDWPKPLENEIWDSLTGFLLDTEKSNEDVLERWDEAVEDSF